MQPTERTCERLGFPKDRAEPLSGLALDKAIAVLVVCHLSTTRKYRLERQEAKLILPSENFQGGQVHCASDVPECCLYKVHLVQGKSREIIESMRRDVKNAKGDQLYAIEHRRYGFCLLVDSEAKKSSLTAAVLRSGVLDECVVRVDLSATAKSIAKYLRTLRRSER